MKLFRISVTVLVLLSFILQPLAPVFAQNVSSSPMVSEKSIEQNSSSTDSVVPVTVLPLTTSSVQIPEPITSSTTLPVPVVQTSSSIPTPEVPAPVETKKIEKKKLFYPELMRSAKKGIVEGNTELKKQTAQDLAEFISQEKERLDDLHVDKKKQKQYLQRLKKQMESLDDSAPGFFEKVKDFFGDIFSGDTATPKTNEVKEEEVKIPNNPASFGFSEEKINIFQLQDPKLFPTPGQKIQQNLKKLITIDVANAMDDQFLPVIEDTQANAEVIVNEPIRELAASLDNNPVNIVNYVRNAIAYEPYFGAKKGNLGCLQEKICNDVDSASLTISLFRAAGIPARYKKSLVTFRVQDLKNILGVEDTKSVYLLFAQNKIPVSTVTVPIPPGATVDQVDISAETHLAVEWVFPEVFYDYDERGANIPNSLSFESVSTTDSMRATLQNFPKKQWIPIDTIVKTYTHTKQNILTVNANLNVPTFWDTFLTYQGGLTPLEKFGQDIQSRSGRTVSSSLSTVIAQNKTYKILPITLPFILSSGSVNGTPINPETWSVLPDVRRDQMRLSLRTTNDQLVLEKNFFASELNNKELNLLYEGLTDADKQVIEQAGGIHNTPADLVDIIPVFRGEMGNFSVPNPVAVNIGDSLVLRFEMYINGQMVQRDEKFSVAGNSEGIYMIFSQVQSHPEWDTNSRILLGGNSALAWEYLRSVEAQRNLLNQFFDYSSQLHFARAVVTENRILSKVNNVATNFDFKGLTIDAGEYISSDVSRRDAFTAHREDFRKLFGLEASYAEGQVFERVSGLQAISTVKGLQYAALHPETYTVSRITRANRAVIDGLLLSENTKANLRTAVDAGDTVITPNKPVQMGNWTGVLYISISPLGVGRYAIGEQVVQNGGWTISDVIRKVYINQSQTQIEGFLANFGTNKFYYEDGRSYESVACRITQAEESLITSRPDWNTQYGQPCFMEVRQFGDVSHTYILTSNGAYFFSPGKYDYWVWKENVKGVLLTDKNGDPGEHLVNVRLDGEFKFNPIAGTFSWFGHFDTPDAILNVTTYYEPNQNRVGHGRLVYGSILEKLTEPYYITQNILCMPQDPYCSKRNWVLNSLGFPLSNLSGAAQSFAGTKGDYQVFVGGHIYTKQNLLDSASFYVPQSILKKFNSDEFLLNGNKGTGGKFGFPLADPFYDRVTNELIQAFEAKMIKFINNQNIVIDYDNHSRRVNTKEYTKMILKKVMKGEISDAEAFARISDYIAYVTNTNEKFVRDLTLLLVGVEKIVSIKDYEKVKKEMYELEQNFYQWGNYPPTGELFSDTGFKFKYNDSHYVQECRRNGKHTYSSNQLYHSMLGFNTGFFWGAGAADAISFGHDFKANPLGIGASIEDRNLGYKMREAGVSLMLNTLSKENVGRWIRENVMDEKESPPRSKITLEQECDIRKNFRLFEASLGNEFGLWSYSQDMKFTNGVYSQLYEKFGDYKVVKAIWDNAQQKVYLLDI